VTERGHCLLTSLALAVPFGMSNANGAPRQVPRVRVSANFVTETKSLEVPSTIGPETTRVESPELHRKKHRDKLRLDDVPFERHSAGIVAESLDQNSWGQITCGVRAILRNEANAQQRASTF
jgi:hypothetical protein